MTSILNRFINRENFESYEDFKENFKISFPENYNFAYDVVDVYAEEDPDKVALVWCNDHGEDHVFTFSDMKKYSNKVANFLTSKGIKKGDHVMLTLKSRYEFWFTILALHKIGAVTVPATHMLKVDDVVYRIEKANIKMVISIDENNLTDIIDKAIEKSGHNMDKVTVEKPKEGWYYLHDEIEKQSDVFERNEENKNEVSDITLTYFSSGTSGMPKMAEHDHMYSLGHIVTAKFWQNVIDDGLHYTVADTGWGKAVWGLLYGQWISGSATFVYDYDKFHAYEMMKKAIDHGITTFCAPPTIYRFLIKEDLSSLDFSNIKYAVTAGEALNTEVFHKFKEISGLEIKEGFGQTETTLSIANFPWIKTAVGSMGMPSPIYDIEIVDEEGKQVDVGEEGEIVIKIKDDKNIGLFHGYHKDPEKTQKTCYDGYYHTGDTAWIDEDNYMWFVGRTDDIIKSSGYKISPFEVESALLTHPAVLDCAVTAYPHKIRGEIIKATIVLTKDYEPSEELKKEIQKHTKRVTAPYKYPRMVEFIDELPKTTNGKLQREAIRRKDLENYKE